MKNLLIPLALLLVVVFLISGCGAKTTTPAQTTAPTGTQPVTTQPVTTTPTGTKPVTTTPTVTQVPTTIAATTPAGGPRYGGTYIWIHNGGITDINPAADGGTVTSRNLSPCLEPLLRFDENGVLRGHLAEKWEASPDGKKITFFLRKNIKFHDGTDFNAEAVKFNMEKTFAAGIPGTAALANVASYEVIDPHTLVLNLKVFDFRVLFVFASTGGVGLIASKAALEKPATPENRAQLHMVGTGPFIFDTWRKDDFVRYKKNPNYWQAGKPYLDAIEIRSVVDYTVAIFAFRSGSANLIENVHPTDAAMLSGMGYPLTMAGLKFIHSFVPSGANPNSPFANKKVREALIYAIDKQKLIDGIGGGAKNGYSTVDTYAIPGFHPFDPKVQPRPYDPKLARLLLDQAGYPNGFKTTLWVDVRAETGWPEALQTSWKQIGIDAKIEIVDVPRVTEISRNGWEGILHRGFPTPGTMTAITDGWGNTRENVSMWRPPGYNDLFSRIISEPDDNKRYNLMTQMQQLIYDEVTAIPYRANSPLKVSDGTVVDPKYMIHCGGWVDVWWPEVFWLDKK